MNEITQSYRYKMDMLSKNQNEVTSDGEFVKKQQCKTATRVWNFNSISGQKWKLDNNLLKNKAGLWKSTDLWTFTTKDNDLIYIENTSKTKVLGATSDGKVIQEVFVADKAEQLWKKGKPDAEGYVTLESKKVLMPMVLTAISESGLEIKGNIINSEINTYYRLSHIEMFLLI